MTENQFYRLKYSALLLILMVLFAPSLLFAKSNKKQKQTKVEMWLTDPAQQVLFQKQNELWAKQPAANPSETIVIDTKQSFQSIDGFGFCLTGGSARLLNEMQPEKRAQLLRELFATDGNNIGTSYLRLSIGASDLSDSVFTYNDLPAGETDVEMERFSIEVEKVYLLPVLKEILAINPNMLIMGSPWTPPVWMKTNNNSKGGSLKPEYYDAYARYFVKYIQAMAAEGIRIDAITVQNEPLHPGNNPSLLMPADEQAAFIKQSLGPIFQQEGIDTKIVIYDHNADRPDYPISILNDPEAKKYIDGSAFHLYGGKIDALSEVHKAHPDRHLYFTEQWVGAPGNLPGDLVWHTRELIIGGTRNWCRNVLEWNLAADSQNKPHTPGGCTQCLGAVTIDGNEVSRNPAYYIIAHAAKFARPGAKRVHSNIPNGLPNVAFQNTDGSEVLVVVNDSSTPRTFQIQWKNEKTTSILNAGAVATYVFRK